MPLKKPKKISVTVQAAMITTIGAVAVALITGFFALAQKNGTPPLTNTLTALPSSTPNPTETPIPIHQIFEETFDYDNGKWTIDPEMTEFNSSGYRTYKHIEGGKYYRVVETNDSYTGNYGSIPIPDVNEKNFCLIFDSRITETSDGTSVIINTRENNFGTGNGSYYIVHLFANGTGLIEDGKKQIGVFEDSIIWSDGQVHTVKISLQGKDIEIFDGQTGKRVYKTTLPDEGLILESGRIRLGLEILNPNQKTTMELDNIYVYDKCP